MSEALHIAVTGLNRAVARTTQDANNIVNASSTGKNVDESLVDLIVQKQNFAANTAVIRTVQKMDKALLDIKV